MFGRWPGLRRCRCSLSSPTSGPGRRHCRLRRIGAGALNLVLAYRGLPPVLLGVVVLLIAGPFMLVALAWHAIARRTHPAVAIVAYPVLVVSADYLRSLSSPHGTFGCLAYSQTDVLPVVQLASVTGMWGISFIVSLVPAALAVMWRGRRTRRVVRVGLGLATLPLALTLRLAPRVSSRRRGMRSGSASRPAIRRLSISPPKIPTRPCQSSAPTLVVPRPWRTGAQGWWCCLRNSWGSRPPTAPRRAILAAVARTPPDDRRRLQ